MTRRAVHLGLLLAATLAGHAVAQFTTFTNLTACDLGASAPAISAQPACSLSNVQVSTPLAPNQAVMVPFNNIYTAGFQSVTYQNLTSVINASNPTGASQTVFFMFGVCDSQSSASSCAVGWLNRAETNAALPGVCSTNCALGTGSDAIITGGASVANWNNPQYRTGVTVNAISISANNPSFAPLNLITRSDTSYSSFGTGFVFFMGSLSTLPINVQLTLTPVITTQSARPSPTPTPTPGPGGSPDSGSSSSMLSSGAIAGIVIGAVVGVILIAALAFFLIKRSSSRKAEVAPTPMPDEPAPKAVAEV